MTDTDRAYLALCAAVYAMGWQLMLDRADAFLAAFEPPRV